MDRQDRQRELGPHPVRPDEHLEGVAFVAGREPEQHHRVVAHVEVREQHGGGAGLERGDRAQRDERAVADAAHLDEHLAGGGAFEDLAAHRPDHSRDSFASAAPTARVSLSEAGPSAPSAVRKPAEPR